MDLRTLLTGVLGVALGLVFVAYPDAVVRAHAAGRTPTDRGGEYGTSSASERWRRAVQVVGVAAVVAGIYFVTTALA